MERKEVIKKIDEFKDAVVSYRDLLLSSRDYALPEIVRNHDQIDKSKTEITRLYTSIEKYIIKFGNNPKMNDGVWNVMYSPYSNAFTSDTLVRVGPSIDMVIDDLNIVSGRLNAVSDEEFKEKLKEVKKSLEEKFN
jgi:hypothetical protein